MRRILQPFSSLHRGWVRLGAPLTAAGVRSLAFSLLIAAALMVIWLQRFGLMGAYFNADAAVTGAMALSPFHWESIYFWGGQRQGSLVPFLAAIPVQLFHMDAAHAGMLSSYLCAALGIGMIVDCLELWPLRLAFAAGCAFPKYAMAQMICSQGSYLQAVLFFLGLELWLLRAVWARVTAPRLAWTGLTLGLLLWSGDNLIFFVPFGAAAALRPIFKEPRERPWPGLVAAWGGGFAAAAALIAVGRWAGKKIPDYSRTENWRGIQKSFAGIDHHLQTLAPLIDPRVQWVFIGAMALGGLALFAVCLWRGTSPGLPALFGLQPALLIAATCVSHWYVVNGRPDRYLILPVLLEILMLLWAFDRMLVLTMTRWMALSIAGALALVVGLSAFREERADDDLRNKGEGLLWRARLVTADAAGCQGILAGYWRSYPYYTISNGRIPADGLENDQRTRVRFLGEEVVRQSPVCLVKDDQRPCPPALRQYGALLRFTGRDLTIPLTGDGVKGNMRYCLYQPD